MKPNKKRRCSSSDKKEREGNAAAAKKMPARNPTSTKKQLEDAKQYIIYTLQATTTSEGSQGKVSGQSLAWLKLPDEFKADRGIALTAFVHGQAGLEDLPECWIRDRGFFLDAVAKSSRLWFSLPEKFQTDCEFPKQFTNFVDDDMIHIVFGKNPQLKEDRHIWETIVSSFTFDADEFWNANRMRSRCSLQHASIAIRSDYDLMLTACCNDPRESGKIAKHLALNRSFVEKVLETKPVALLFFKPKMHQHFPDLVQSRFQALFEVFPLNIHKDRSSTRRFYGDCDVSRRVSLHTRLCKALLKNIGAEVYNKRSFAQAWFTAGGPYVPHTFPISWKDDEEIMLWNAKYESIEFYSFVHASKRLKSDLEFLMKITMFQPDPIMHAPAGLCKNLELVIQALSHSGAHAGGIIYLRSTQMCTARWIPWKAKLRQHIEERVKLHAIYDEIILPQFSSAADDVCPLIAEFLDVPLGERIHVYAKALNNVSRYV